MTRFKYTWSIKSEKKLYLSLSKISAHGRIKTSMKIVIDIQKYPDHNKIPGHIVIM